MTMRLPEEKLKGKILRVTPPSVENPVNMVVVTMITDELEWLAQNLPTETP
jgi:hypothetical protein